MVYCRREDKDTIARIVMGILALVARETPIV